MIHRPILRLAIALVGLLAWAEAAHAQSSACQRYRAELASLGRSGGHAAAHRQRAEVSRLTGYYHAIGCGQGGFFAPPECNAIAHRINAMQATYGRSAGQADDSSARRRQLIAAIRQACQPQREARLEVKPSRPVEKIVERPRVASRDRDADDDRPRGGLGGSRIVCVRACDGSFFPLTNMPSGGRAGPDQMCQALCPGAETAAYSMPGSEDTELNRAVSLKGRPYTRLANAFKFQKGFNAACSCKKNGQTWAQVLGRAETLLGRHRGDIIVTAQRAEELSRPKIAFAAKRGRDKKKSLDVETTGSVSASAAQATAAKAAEAAGGPAKPEDVAAIPTASRASAGIGPKSIASAKVIGKNDGLKREVTDDQGVKRTVRIVAPNVIPVPAQMTETPSPAPQAGTP